jgi:hypothetical protein
MHGGVENEVHMAFTYNPVSNRYVSGRKEKSHKTKSKVDGLSSEFY